MNKGRTGQPSTLLGASITSPFVQLNELCTATRWVSTLSLVTHRMKGAAKCESTARRSYFAVLHKLRVYTAKIGAYGREA
jgi:hypothetical protein